jgi:MFS transporter, DHA1 family, tetracycline resistance protein
MGSLAMVILRVVMSGCIQKELMELIGDVKCVFILTIKTKSRHTPRMLSNFLTKLKSPLSIVFLTVFLDLLGNGILIPVLPFLLTIKKFGFNVNPSYLLPQDFDANAAFILFGFLLASYAFGQFLATPILGQMSDKIGRRKVLAFSLAGTCLSYFIFAYGIYTRNIGLLFAARFFDGLTGGNISVAQAIIADISTPASRTKNFGLIGAAFGLGFIFGPYIGGKLSLPSTSWLNLGFINLTTPEWFNATTPFIFAGLLAACNVLFVLLALPETNVHIDNLKKIELTKSFQNIMQAFRTKELKVQFLVNFLYQGGFTFFTTFAGTYFAQKFLFTQGTIGDFYAFIGICVAITQAVITRKLAAKYSERIVLNYSYIFCGVGVLMYLFTPANASNIFWLIGPFFSVFTGLSQANSISLISKTTSPEKQGQVLGINSSVQALGQTIPAVLSGFIVGQLESSPTSASASLVVSAIVIISAGLVFNIFYKPQKLVSL